MRIREERPHKGSREKEHTIATDQQQENDDDGTTPSTEKLWNLDEIETDYVNTGTFEEVYRSVFPRLYNFAVRIVNTWQLTDVTPDDLLQVAAAKAHANWESYTQGTYALGWMKKILENVARNAYRKQLRQPQNLDNFESVIDAMPHIRAQSAESIVIEEASYQELRDMFDEVPEAYRGALKLVIIEDLPYKDAADALGIPLNTVLTRVHRGRKALREIIAERWKDKER